MAAKTPSSVILVGAIGSNVLKRAVFTDIDDTDTWAYGGEGLVDAWFNKTDDPSTAASATVGVSISSGTVTFNCGEDNNTGTLFMLCAGI